MSLLKKGTAKTLRTPRTEEVQRKSSRSLRLCGEKSSFFNGVTDKHGFGYVSKSKIRVIRVNPCPKTKKEFSDNLLGTGLTVK